MTPAGVVLLCLFIIFAISLAYNVISSRMKSKNKGNTDSKDKE